MNFLAHIYLSGNDEFLTIGNFIADHVKGRAIESFPENIKKGILLHRKIDNFTDHHPQVLKSKVRLRPRFHKFSPVVADIFYDHFLAVNWNNYSDIKLENFVADFYMMIEKNSDILPERTRKMLPFMISNNWLVAYSKIEGINKILTSMSRRTAFNSGMENAATDLVEHYDLYQEEFNLFFPELKEFVRKEIKK